MICSFHVEIWNKSKVYQIHKKKKLYRKISITKTHTERFEMKRKNLLSLKMKLNCISFDFNLLSIEKNRIFDMHELRERSERKLKEEKKSSQFSLFSCFVAKYEKNWYKKMEKSLYKKSGKLVEI